MSGIRLTWEIGLFEPERHLIFRSDSAIDPNNLPDIPLAEVGSGISLYEDLTIIDGETYHYMVVADKKGLLCPTDTSIEVLAEVI